MIWVGWAWRLVLLAVAAHCGARLVLASRAPARREGGGEPADLVALDVLMAVALAGMLSPVGDPVSAAAGRDVFILAAAWSLVAALRAREPRRRVTWMRQAVTAGTMASMFAAMPMPPALTGALVACFGCAVAWSAAAMLRVEVLGAARTLPAAALAPPAVAACDAAMAGAMVYLLLAMR